MFIFVLLVLFSAASFPQDYNHHINNISTGYILVDSVPNCFGGAGSELNPIVFDPYANILGIVHRGHPSYAEGNGKLFYNISTDFGGTWQRKGPLNNEPFGGRYPSMCISNPGRGNMLNSKAAFVWAELWLGDMTDIGFGVDYVFGSGQFSADTIQGNYSWNKVCWASDTSDYVFWCSMLRDLPGIKIFRTQDFTNLNIYTINDSVFNGGFLRSLGGVSYNGTQYLGFLGDFPDPDPVHPIKYGTYPAYYKSTDEGVTWSGPVIVDFRSIPALSMFDELCNYSANPDFTNFDGDINIDKYGYVHFAIGVTDTNSTPHTHAIVNVFETAQGWDATIVTADIVDPKVIYSGGPGIEQMGYSCYLAFDKDREIMVMQWQNVGNVYPWCDVYQSYKYLNSTTWNYSYNLTQSDYQHNTQSHLAPVILPDFSGCLLSYYAFSTYTFTLNPSSPSPDPTEPAGIYFRFTEVSNVNENNSPADYSLSGNYPNPFNPSTNIRYSIPVKEWVTIRIYDMLGKEIKTLLNEEKDRGAYEAKFTSDNLSSGVYLYTLQAGNFFDTGKMILIK